MDREQLKAHKSRCETLDKKKSQYNSKIREYTKKKNSTKVSAYETKLGDTTSKLDALNAEIKTIIQSTTIPAAELDKLKKQLKRAGCTP